MTEDDPELRSIPAFDRDYEAMQTQGKHERINDGLEAIVDDPKGNSKHLEGDYKGKRKHRVGDYRILFAYCPECMERNDVKHNDCADCDELHNDEVQNIIKLFETGDRSNIYD